MDRKSSLRRLGASLCAVLFLVCIIPGLIGAIPAQVAYAQQPTGSIATVTGTPAGPFVRVDQSVSQVRIYAGPSSFDYPAVGVLVAGETAPAIGRARGREDWIQIIYLGVPGSTAWVFGLYVSLSPGALLPLVALPPTPTPLSTPTINPTLEAAFIGQQTPTRLSTFTPPSAPIELPQFTDATEAPETGIPIGFIVLILALFGFFGAVISYLQGR